MLNKSFTSQSFSIVETPKILSQLFIGLGTLVLFIGLIGDALKLSPLRFGGYELVCVVVGVICIFSGISLHDARKKSLEVPFLPEKLFRQFSLAIIIGGMGLSLLSGLFLANQSNSSDMFANLIRTPPVESMRFANVLIPFIAGFFIMVLGVRLDEHGQKIIPAILKSMIFKWKSISQPVKIVLFAGIVLLIGTFNYALVMREPFVYQGGWDAWTGAYRRITIVPGIEGLKKGCILCTGDLKPLESITDGDDIGLSFIFAIVVKLNLFTPALDSYQQFIGLLVGGSIAFGALIVAVGYRSLLAGLTFGIFISLFSSVPLYQTLLITPYWVPGGAAIMTCAFLLAIIARSERDRPRGRRETALYIVGFAIWGFMGGLSYLGRSNAGVSTLLPAVVVLLYLLVRYRWYTRVAVAFVVLLIAAALPILAFRYTLSWRFGVYNPPDSSAISHSFSHALYVGLGFVTNSEDIRWLDTVGYEHAQQQCSPNIVILSADYYECMRNLFIKTVVNDPGLLVRNLLAKYESILQTSLTHLSFFWLLPLVFLLIRPKFIYLVLLFTLVMFLLPGLLVFPYFSYILGYEEVLIAALVVAIVGFFQSLSASLSFQ